MFSWNNFSLQVRNSSLYLLRVAFFLVVLHGVLHAALIVTPDAASRQLGWFEIESDYANRVREQLGLSGNGTTQYINHLANLLRGDWGRSLHGNYEIGPFMATRILHSAPLLSLALLWIAFFPIPLAMSYARATSSRTLGVVRTIAAVGLIPQFLAAILGYAFYEHFFRPNVPAEFASLMRLVFASGALAVTPAMIVFVSAADTFEDVTRRPWVTVAHAMGHSWSRIRAMMVINVLYELRPLVTRVALHMFLGTAFAEMIFGIPGIGAAFISALATGDTPLLFAIVFMFGAIVLVLSGLEEREELST